MQYVSLSADVMTRTRIESVCLFVYLPTPWSIMMCFVDWKGHQELVAVLRKRPKQSARGLSERVEYSSVSNLFLPYILASKGTVFTMTSRYGGAFNMPVRPLHARVLCRSKF